jgi:GntR family transcriptional repressor for pyruvate dehydrogenase complex
MAAEPAGLFEPVRREPTLAATVAQGIERLIREGRLAAGAHLPSERALAEQFGVSRTVVREAVRTVAASGLLDVRHGSGTLVTAPPPELVARSVSHYLRAREVAHVHEIRRMLETEIAGVAAERRTEADVDRLRELLAELPARAGDRAALAAADIEFHRALAAATRNPFFAVLHDSLADVLLTVRRHAFSLAGSVELAHGHHSRILEAVAAADAPAARDAMRRHLVDGERWLRRALEQGPVA